MFTPGRHDEPGKGYFLLDSVALPLPLLGSYMLSLKAQPILKGPVADNLTSAFPLLPPKYDRMTLRLCSAEPLPLTFILCVKVSGSGLIRQKNSYKCLAEETIVAQSCNA